jgi:hypothetical protein
MSDSAKEAWTQVGERFSSWGRRVADAYHDAEPDRRSDADEAEAELKRAAKELMDEIARGTTALGATMKDEEARRDLTDAVSALGDAITATVNEATRSIRSGSAPRPDRPEE